MKIFLDSGIFIAFLNRRDRWHTAAVALFSGPPPDWHTSWLVVSETYSWFLHRMGEEAARGFRLVLDSMDSLKILDANRQHHEQVVAILNRFRGTKLTYVDASGLALLQQHDIHCVWATDHHLGIAGAEVLPER